MSLNCPSKELMKEKLDILNNFESVNATLLPRWLSQGTQNFEKFRSWRDLADIKGTYSGTAILCASGPTLLEDLEAAPEGTIICAQSQLGILHDVGITPTLCGVLDPHEGTIEQLERQWDRKKTTIITVPTVHPKALELMPPGFLVRETNQGSPYHTGILPLMYPHIQSELMPLGTSGNFLYEIAWYLGFSQVYLAGYAYGVKDLDKQRTFHQDDEEKKVSQYGELLPANREGWWTSTIFNAYKVGLYVCILNRRLKIAHIGDPGNLEEIPIGEPKFDFEPYKKYLEGIGYVFEGKKMTWKGIPKDNE